MNGSRNFILLILLIAPFSLILAQSTFEWAELEAKADDLVKQNGSVGASVIVVNRDSILFCKGFGLGSLENHDAITDST